MTVEFAHIQRGGRDDEPIPASLQSKFSSLGTTPRSAPPFAYTNLGLIPNPRDVVTLLRDQHANPRWRSIFLPATHVAITKDSVFPGLPRKKYLSITDRDASPSHVKAAIAAYTLWVIDAGRTNFLTTGTDVDGVVFVVVDRGCVEARAVGVLPFTTAGATHPDISQDIERLLRVTSNSGKPRLAELKKAACIASGSDPVRDRDVVQTLQMLREVYDRIGTPSGHLETVEMALREYLRDDTGQNRLLNGRRVMKAPALDRRWETETPAQRPQAKGVLRELQKLVREHTYENSPRRRQTSFFGRRRRERERRASASVADDDNSTNGNGVFGSLTFRTISFAPTKGWITPRHH